MRLHAARPDAAAAAARPRTSRTRAGWRPASASPTTCSTSRRRSARASSTPSSTTTSRGRTPSPVRPAATPTQVPPLPRRARAPPAPTLVATGHYARRARRRARRLLTARATRAKDQSYFLFGIAQAELARTLFPVGDLDKERGARARPVARPAQRRQAREPGDLLRRGRRLRRVRRRARRARSPGRARSATPTAAGRRPPPRHPPLHRRPAQGLGLVRPGAALRARDRPRATTPSSSAPLDELRRHRVPRDRGPLGRGDAAGASASRRGSRSARGTRRSPAAVTRARRRATSR